MQILTQDALVERIDAFQSRHPRTDGREGSRFPDSRIGRDTTGESSLVSDIRAGRFPRPDTLMRLFAWMAEKDEAGSDTGDAALSVGNDGAATDPAATETGGAGEDEGEAGDFGPLFERRYG